MADLDKQAIQKRLDQISQIFSDVVAHAEETALHRCPYRDRHDLCTALFRCRNQRPVPEDPEAFSCGHEGQFDYRSAWETNPRAEARTKEKIADIRREAEERRRGEPGKEPPT